MLVMNVVLPSRIDVMITREGVALGAAEAIVFCVGAGEEELQLVVSISFAFCAMHFSFFGSVRQRCRAHLIAGGSAVLVLVIEAGRTIA